MIQTDQSTRFKNMLIMTLFLIFLFGFLYLLSYPNFFGISFSIPSFSSSGNVSPQNEQVLSLQDESIFEDLVSKNIYGMPEKIIIENLGINIKLVSVGVDDMGYLETPKNWNEGGWYRKGAKPSEPGNLLINAHYDDSSGRPAAFWNLKNINVGDKVSVLDGYSRTFDYKVTKVYYVDINDPERTKVFEPYEEGKSLMTLITCGGVWSSMEGTYAKRLVVNAELISE